ncbi:MAG: helix-turn-helix domain-containing protein, partial [Gaiellaceae bacterium]
MSLRTDGWRSLLDVLVDSVERGGSGEEIAARAHVSRFHFDRIVSAALRETPAAFRRRLLLERAAWTLTNDASV